MWLWWVVCGGSGERDQLVPCRPRSARRPLPHPSKRKRYFPKENVRFEMKLNIDITFPLRPSGWASGSTIFKNIGRNGICSTLHEVGLYLVLSQDVEGISSQIFVPGVRWGRVVGGLWLWWVVCGGRGERDQLVPCRPRSARRPLPHLLPHNHQTCLRHCVCIPSGELVVPLSLWGWGGRSPMRWECYTLRRIRPRDK